MAKKWLELGATKPCDGGGQWCECPSKRREIGAYRNRNIWSGDPRESNP